MRDGPRAEIAARVLLTLGALIPYWRLLTFSVIYVTDDFFASDIFNAELPGRALVGQLIRQGQAPVWTSQLCSGVPLAGVAADPIGLATFTLLPPAAALDLLVIVLLMVAAHGAYGLARRVGAARSGAVLAGLAFAGSGYIACQLKHLGIVATVVWLPVGLLLIDRVFDGRAPTTHARRTLLLGLFGLVFAQQVLSGFPQSVYICALVYGAFALFRVIAEWSPARAWPVSLSLLAGLGVATALGAAAGAVVLIPLSELGNVSDRAEPLGWAWSTRLAYWPPNVLTFLSPYINGDISNNTYMGPPFFWEDYGYVGVATFLLAIYGAARQWRRPMVAFVILMTIVAYLFVLGSATPVFRVAYDLVPGMSMFRFPTRFLIVVELGLALLGALGLTSLGAFLKERWKEPSRTPQLIVVAVCVGTALDLFIHQPRQNPMVPARDWLAPPRTVGVIHGDTERPRTFTPQHRSLHRRTFLAARGWADVGPYFDLREVLQPNLGGGLWDTPSADCYAGISPRWSIDVWGDHNRESALVPQLASLDFEARTFSAHPALAKVLGMYGVSHVLSPFPLQEARFALVSQEKNAYVYRVDGAARVRFVRAARHVRTDREALARVRDADFDPNREILLHDVADSVGPNVDAAAGMVPANGASRATVTHEDSRDIVIDAEAPEDGFLLVADTFYPGWTAHVDGQPTPIYRANISVRGIALPKGRHEVRLSYAPAGVMRGLRITLVALAALLIWVGGAAYVARRGGRAPRHERSEP